MGPYILRRLLWLIPVVFAVSAITFAMMHLVPGGPWSSERAVSTGIQAHINATYHLDESIPQQYVRWVASFVQGDFGPSFRYEGRGVNAIIADGLPKSIWLGTMAFIVAVALGIPLGVFAALGHNKAPDYLATGVSIIGIATPSFVLAILLVVLFSVILKWFPTSGWKGPDTWVLPVIALAGYQVAVIARYTRASMLEVTRKDYIRTAHSKGIQGRAVVSRHMMRNALIPVATILGPIFAFLVTGSFIIETFFGIPGVGRYYVQAIGGRDYGMIMATTVIFALAVAVLNVIVDVAYAFIDPRIRYS
jgi:ABC-type dipeptide/oligopeptide/nickel transport system permease component